MKYIIAGIGNPGTAYEKTRHNAGRRAVFALSEHHDGFEWHENTKINGDVAEGVINGHEVMLLLPNTYMNLSGLAVLKAGITKDNLGRLVVVYDDIDLPLGMIRISYSRGTGGHRGIDSITKSAESRDYVRVRMGIALITPSGKIDKPRGEQQIEDFVLGRFTAKEEVIFKSVVKKVHEAIAVILDKGYQQAMNEFN